MRYSVMAFALMMLVTVLYAADADYYAGELVKKIGENTNSENGFIKAIRYYQFTASKEKENFSAYLFNKENLGAADALKDLGLKGRDKGEFLFAVRDRSASRLIRLWKSNRSSIFKILNSTTSKDDITAAVVWLVAVHDSDCYTPAIDRMKILSPKLDASTLSIAESVANEKRIQNLPLSYLKYDHYSSSRDALAFWYRRTAEKNDKEVYAILKEIQLEFAPQAFLYKPNPIQENEFNTLCKTGSPSEIENALKRSDIEHLDSDGFTPLMCAAYYNPNPEVVRILIKAGASLGGFRGYTVIECAARNNNPAVIKALLAAGASISPDYLGSTPLFDAAFYNKNPEVIKVFLKAGASVNAEDTGKDTPLMAAARSKDQNPEVVLELLKSGANAKVKDCWGNTALYQARQNPKLYNSPVYQVLKKATEE